MCPPTVDYPDSDKNLEYEETQLPNRHLLLLEPGKNILWNYPGESQMLLYIQGLPVRELAFFNAWTILSIQCRNGTYECSKNLENWDICITPPNIVPKKIRIKFLDFPFPWRDNIWQFLTERLSKSYKLWTILILCFQDGEKTYTFGVIPGSWTSDAVWDVRSKILTSLL